MEMIESSGKYWWKSAWFMAFLFVAGVVVTGVTDRITMATSAGMDSVRLATVESSIRDLRDSREEHRKIISEQWLLVSLRLQHIDDTLKQMQEGRKLK